MTPSPNELERLRVRVRELEEELAEWRRIGSEDLDETVHKWRRALKVLPQPAHIAIILCASPGRFMKTGYLHDTIAVSEDAQGNLVGVAVSRLRTALKGHGIPNAIHNEYGHGYMITPEGARQVRALVEG